MMPTQGLHRTSYESSASSIYSGVVKTNRFYIYMQYHVNTNVSLIARNVKSAHLSISAALKLLPAARTVNAPRRSVRTSSPVCLC